MESQYALVSRVRLVPQDDVVDAAEEMVEIIVARYGETNMTIEGFREFAAKEQTQTVKKTVAFEILECRR